MPAPNPTTVLFDRPPATPDELWESVRILWGVQLPRTPICDNDEWVYAEATLCWRDVIPY